jgi:hypothetical protein
MDGKCKKCGVDALDLLAIEAKQKEKIRHLTKEISVLREQIRRLLKDGRKEK